MNKVPRREQRARGRTGGENQRVVYAKLHPVLDPLSEDLQADLQIK